LWGDSVVGHQDLPSLDTSPLPVTSLPVQSLPISPGSSSHHSDSASSSKDNVFDTSFRHQTITLPLKPPKPLLQPIPSPFLDHNSFPLLPMSLTTQSTDANAKAKFLSEPSQYKSSVEILQANGSNFNK
ncbi:hypothetical protein VP01_7649g1, partial [Puccinia sorghi]